MRTPAFGKRQVILNLSAIVDMKAFEKQMYNRVRRSKIDGLDIIILEKSKLLKILRYKK